MEEKRIGDGGPAFPTKRMEHVPFRDNPEDGIDVIAEYPGLSIRDYFAAQALIANKGWIVGTADDAARDAYTIADAMLKARGDSTQ